MSKKQLKFLIGGVVILAAIGALAGFAISKNAVYYYTVSELVAGGPRQDVRVSGQLLAGTVDGGGVGESLKFEIYDKLPSGEVAEVSSFQGQVLAVNFTGTIPDSFKDDPKTEVVLEGDFSPDGTFYADYMLAKCPSKYEAAADEEAEAASAGGSSDPQ